MNAPKNALPSYDLGKCRVTLVSGGRLKLDGGAMFGIIPKPLWSRGAAADDQNRIQLHCNCLLVEWLRETARRVIIETGTGSKYAEKEQRIFDIQPHNWLLPALVAAGIDPVTITDVVVSHLHFDHAGGLTYEQDGRLLPTFPRARVHVQKKEYEDAKAGFGIMTATYRPENLTPLDVASQWNLLDGEVEIAPGIRTVPAPGHTRGHQAVVVQGGDRAMVFGGDVMPTAAHLGAPYNMGYDLFPLENRASKSNLLRWVAQRDGLLAIDHEPHTPIVGVAIEKDWYRLVAG